MPEFEKLIEELMVKYPELLGSKWFRELEKQCREEIIRWEEIMDSAGIA